MNEPKYLTYSMTTAANDDRVLRVTARLKVALEEAIRLFNERKVMSGNFNFQSRPHLRTMAEMVVVLEKRQVAVFSARDSEVVRGDGFVVFLPMEVDHRHRPDNYVGGLIEAVINGEYVTREVFDEVLAIASPAEAVVELREALAKLESRT